MASTWNVSEFSVIPAALATSKNDTAGLGLELFEKLLPSTIFFTVLICLGIPGNLLVFIVYLKKFKVSSTRVFVLAMSACDIFVCLVAVIVHVVYIRFMYTVSDSFCRVMFLVLTVPIFVSGWILVCASLDRRHRVCQPLKRQLSARQATYVLVVPLGLAVLTTAPFTAFKGKVNFTTVTGLSVKKCGFYSESEFSETIVGGVEGSLLSVCCLVGLTLLIWSYSHILYRIKLQNKRKRDNFACDTRPADTTGRILSAPEANRVLAVQAETTQVDCKRKSQETCSSCDPKTSDEVVNGSTQQAQCWKAKTREAIEEKRQLTGRLQESRNSLASKTTLLIFVMTITNAVCLLPYVIWTQFQETYYEPQLSSWTMNLVTTSNYLPSLRSTITPLIYICVNPRFRQHCRRCLAGILNFCS